MFIAEWLDIAFWCPNKFAAVIMIQKPYHFSWIIHRLVSILFSPVHSFPYVSMFSFHWLFTFMPWLLRVVTHNLETGTAMGDKRTWDCVKKPVTYSHSAPNDNFLICFGFIPSFPHSLQQCCGQKKHSFPPMVLKINFVWGGRGGATSFTNITGNVLTLLTSIVPIRGGQPLLSGTTTQPP